MKTLTVSDETWEQIKDQVTNKKYLKLIQKNLKIKELCGCKIIHEAKDIFEWIDDDFKNWNVSEKRKSSEAKLSVYELKEDATYQEMFSSLGDLDDLVLTDNQVLEFTEKHKDWSREDGYCTFFLLKKEDKFFVAHVNDAGRLNVSVYVLEDDRVWNADDRLYVVVPQL